jgi:hypothetical protein
MSLIISFGSLIILSRFMSSLTLTTLKGALRLRLAIKVKLSQSSASAMIDCSANPAVVVLFFGFESVLRFTASISFIF